MLGLKVEPPRLAPLATELRGLGIEMECYRFLLVNFFFLSLFLFDGCLFLSFCFLSGLLTSVAHD